MPYGTVNADVITTSTAGGVLGAGNASIMKNRIINGAMVIDQRNAGASVTNVATDTYTLDRWQYSASQASKFTLQQNAGSVTTPAGFKNYLGITSTSAYSIGSGDYYALSQVVEGFNTADLGWGTASAKTVTLSFQVYSSLTGTFGGAIQNGNNDRSYPFSYTISSANTWTTISVTIAGDTTGTWVGSTNGRGMYVRFGFGVGSTYSGTAGSWAGANYFSSTGATSVVGTNGATFYITGVQLEVGSSATGFEYVNYQTSLANCQRYFRLMGSASRPFYVGGYTNNSNDTEFPYSFGVDLRATPTVTITTLSNTNGVPYSDTASTDKTSIGLTRTTTGTQTASFYATVSAEL
jgi:hypothetical protein